MSPCCAFSLAIGLWLLLEENHQENISFSCCPSSNHFVQSVYSDDWSTQILHNETLPMVGCPLITSCFHLKEGIEVKFLGCCKKCNPFVFFLKNNIKEQFVPKTLVCVCEIPPQFRTCSLKGLSLSSLFLQALRVRVQKSWGKVGNVYYVLVITWYLYCLEYCP